MTNKERIIKTLLCEQTDRAPFSAWLGFAPWGETIDRWKQESGLADLDTWSYFGFEPFFHVPPAHMGPVPSFFAKRHNIPILSVDTDGQVEQLVPAFMRHGVNAMMPFEVQAGNDVVAYRKQYPKLGIMGGLDKSALAKGKPEMHRELDRAEQMLALGGWIPGLDHLVPPDVSWANFTYFVENVRKMVFKS